MVQPIRDQDIARLVLPFVTRVAVLQLQQKCRQSESFPQLASERRRFGTV